MPPRRNSLCTCGSNKRYKHCCGSLEQPLDKRASRDRSPEELQKIAEMMLRKHNAAEDVRTQQQGYGKPIVSFENERHRFVIVGMEVFWSSEWHVFPDFLLYFMKKTLSFEWGQREKDKSPCHPLFEWLRRLQSFNEENRKKGKLIHSAATAGYVSAVFHLAYALYLIAHNDQLPKPLLRRLRDRSTFMPAYYETLVGAAMAVAGFEIENAEVGARSKAWPEFRATSKTSGKMYEVEAKRKEGWTADTSDWSNEAFEQELIKYLRGRVHAASKKKLQKPVFWIELSIPSQYSEEGWKHVAEVAGRAIDGCENITIDGEPIAPAYVVVTNHTFMANQDVTNDPCFAILRAIGMPDFPYGRSMEVEAALEGYDIHRDVFAMMKGWAVARTVPTTYDGTPPELLGPDGVAIRPLQIGDTVEVKVSDSSTKVMRVEEIAAENEKGYAFVVDPDTDDRHCIQFALSPEESSAAAKYTDAVFGKDNPSTKIDEDDLFGLYDFHLRVYARSTPAQLKKLLEKMPHVQTPEELGLDQVRVRIAREYTKTLWDMRGQKRDATSASPNVTK